MAESTYYKKLMIRLPDGTEGAVVVDLPTYNAAVIENDHTVVQEIVQNFMSLQRDETDAAVETAKHDTTPADGSTLTYSITEAALPEKTATSMENGNNDTSEKTKDSIWSSDRSEEGKKRDRLATHKLLEIISTEKYTKLFKDNKTKKSSVWNMVAKEMTDDGFPIYVQGKSPGFKCDQKFRNLERQYKDFVQNANTTGKGKKEKPEFYEEMHAIWASKHTVQPVSLVDTFCANEPTPSEPHQGTTTCPYPKTTTPAPKTCLAKRKKNKTTEVLAILHQMSDENKERQDKTIKLLEGMAESLDQNHKELLQEDRRQFESMVQVHKEKMEMQRSLIAAFTGSHKSKRRRQRSSDSD